MIHQMLWLLKNPAKQKNHHCQLPKTLHPPGKPADRWPQLRNPASKPQLKLATTWRDEETAEKAIPKKLCSNTPLPKQPPLRKKMLSTSSPNINPSNPIKNNHNTPIKNNINNSPTSKILIHNKPIKSALLTPWMRLSLSHLFLHQNCSTVHSLKFAHRQALQLQRTLKASIEPNQSRWLKTKN